MVTLGADWQLGSQEVDDRVDVSPYLGKKRWFDFVIACAAAIVLLPVSLLVALAVAIDSRGPILYAQERVGLDRRRGRGPTPITGNRRKKHSYGQPFTIYKFRSMVADAEKHTGPVWAKTRDPRATRVGNLLRRTHLDELPQLLNVLRGDMSMVGPRPERPQLFGNLVAEIPEYALRCKTLPGITGIAQIKNGYDDSMESAVRKIHYDLYYIRNGSLLLDLKLIWSTALVFLKGKQKE